MLALESSPGHHYICVHFSTLLDVRNDRILSLNTVKFYFDIAQDFNDDKSTLVQVSA